MKPLVYHSSIIRSLLSFVIAAFFFLPHLHAAGISFQADLTPRQIEVGEYARLTLRISGNTRAKPTLPEIDGLSLNFVGENRQFEMINFQSNITTIYVYNVVANKPGKYSITPIDLAASGQTLRAAPLSLEVTDSGASSAQPAPASQSNPEGDASTTTSSSATKLDIQLTDEERKSSAFVRFVPEKKVAYVGELIPLQIRAYFHRVVQVRLNSLPSVEGTAFTLSKLDDKPSEQSFLLDGETFTVLTWNTAISAFKEGSFPVHASFSASLFQNQKSQNNIGGVFDDPFFDSFFKRVQRQDVNLKSKDLTLTILPLPEKDRPEAFTGAVGHFEVNVAPSSTQVTAGDPITLKMSISGKGNFDQVTAPKLTDANGWNTYKPTSKFYPENVSGTSGRKDFEQAMIPRSSAISSIPPLEFCYFDPDTTKYVLLRTPPIQLKVISSGTTPTTAPSNPQQGTQPTGNSLLPNRPYEGNFVSTLTPLWKKPWLIILNGFFALAILTGIILYRVADARAKRHRDQLYQQNAKIRAAMNDVKQAALEHNSAHFIKSSRSACQALLAPRLRLPAEAITSADLNDSLGEDSEKFRRIFSLLDATDYSGQPISLENMQEIEKLLLETLPKPSSGRNS